MTKCVSCEETITNPLCPSCLAEGVTQWLMEKRIYHVVSKYKGFSEDSCIKCNASIDLCSYCFTKHIYEELKDAKIDRKILTEFLTFFHLDLGKKGYLEKAVEDGVIL